RSDRAVDRDGRRRGRGRAAAGVGHCDGVAAGGSNNELLRGCAADRRGEVAPLIRGSGGSGQGDAAADAKRGRTARSDRRGRRWTDGEVAGAAGGAATGGDRDETGRRGGRNRARDLRGAVDGEGRRGAVERDGADADEVRSGDDDTRTDAAR